MRAILVSVDYSDLLSITLPYNRHYFDDAMVVTSYDDLPNVLPITKANNCKLHVTNAFYDNSTRFNKWKALEEGLDVFGREGWLCVMDADVLWPRNLVINEQEEAIFFDSFLVTKSKLCSPLRRMWNRFPSVYPMEWGRLDIPGSVCIPQEENWNKFPIHRNVNEWAGYSQIFHASDVSLGTPPWHDIDWQHAGGADSFFQMKWARENKIRPPFEVLHLGEAGKNWFGRATPYIDGTVPSDAFEKLARMDSIWRERRGKIGPDRFKGEKVE